MQAIEFQTTVKKIISAVPEDKRGDLDSHTEDDMVRVIILASPSLKQSKQKDLLQDAKEKGYDDFFEYLIDNPLEVPNPVRYTREQLHERG